MARLPALRDEIDHWFFSQYFKDFIAIAAGRLEPGRILTYWGAPIHMSGPTYARWITSPEDVVQFLKDMQGMLRQAGYAHTEVVDSDIIIYSENASRVETIMSRCRADGTEMDRAAISFEVRRTDESWIIISTTAQPTGLSKLHDVW